MSVARRFVSASLAARRALSTRAASGESANPNNHARIGIILTSAIGVGFYATRKPNATSLPTIHSDAPEQAPAIDQVSSTDKVDWLSVSTDPTTEKLTTLVWGTNRQSIIAPDTPTIDAVRVPTGATWLADVALRDLALDEQHAACVDATGDVYQWGNGFIANPSGDRKPTATLRGKNIISLKTTATRVFALSSSGSIFVLPASLSGSLDAQEREKESSPSWLGFIWGSRGPRSSYTELTPHQKLGWGERFTSIATGQTHLLALTSSGRTFVHPLTPLANTHGQLGSRTFDIPASTPLAIGARAADGGSTAAVTNELLEVPALRGVHAAQIAAGGRTSFVRTTDGRVLGWGANEYGQLGLGANNTLDVIARPTEIVLTRGLPAGTRSRCLSVAAAGDLTFFTTERTDGSSIGTVDVLACGNGQWGGLGGAVYTNAQRVPTRVRNASGLLEFCEKTQNLQPIVPHALSVSSTGHALLTLDTLSRAGTSASSVVGRDLLVWGANSVGELGTGKRGSSAMPVGLPMGVEGQRFMLTTRRARAVRDLEGRVWRRGVRVEQVAAAGPGCTVVYWHIC